MPDGLVGSRVFIPGCGYSIPVMLPSGEWGWTETEAGLTKRELFAAMAMQGLLADPTVIYVGGAAKQAVKHADALLAALESTKEET